MKTLTERCIAATKNFEDRINKEMPNVILCWTNKGDGDHFFDTRLRKEEPQKKRTLGQPNPIIPDSWGRVGINSKRYWETDKIYISAGSLVIYAYCHWDNKNKIFSMAKVIFDTHRPATINNYKWKIIDIVCLQPGDKQFYTRDGYLAKSVLDDRFYHSSIEFWLLNFYKLPHISKNLKNALIGYVGNNYFITAANHLVVIDDNVSLYMLQMYLSYCEPMIKKGPTYNQIAELNKINWPEIPTTALPALTEDKFSYCWRTSPNDVAVVQEQNDVCCIRLIQRRYSFNSNIDISSETLRVFITKKRKVIVARKLTNGEWIPCGNIGADHLSGSVILANEEFSSPFKYIKEIIEHTEIRPLKAIINLIKYPLLEKLAKTEISPLLKNILVSDHPMQDLVIQFGPINSNSSSPLGALGISIYQGRKIVESAYDLNQISTNFNIVAQIKYQLGQANISALDNATTDLLLRGWRRYYPTGALSSWTVDQLIKKWGGLFEENDNPWNRSQQRVHGEDIDNWGKFFIKLCRWDDTGQEPTALKLLEDAYDLYRQMYPQPVIDWDVKNRAQIIRIHDNLIPLYNATHSYNHQYTTTELAHLKEVQAAEQIEQQKLYEKNKQERDRLNYEDDDFIIRSPKDLSELTTEGTKLNHCVGGYIEKQAQGRTNILFLRHRDDPDTPFYTIEISPTKQLGQIHGFGNRWLGNNPEAIPTVLRWLKKNQIEFDANILTNTSIGYGGGGNNVPLPVID